MLIHASLPPSASSALYLIATFSVTSGQLIQNFIIFSNSAHSLFYFLALILSVVHTTIQLTAYILDLFYLYSSSFDSLIVIKANV